MAGLGRAAHLKGGPPAHRSSCRAQWQVVSVQKQERAEAKWLVRVLRKSGEAKWLVCALRARVVAKWLVHAVRESWVEN